ncbi:hypothetical protein NLJ89_g7207 [Agrocybe chaxingu]|uniref:BTB domain-containing protein n=1 Tax=Agrocybe chaxingu TaxID=84603 RepID=A0A9W8JUZ4_9AGAR|nr:hypothetical protein NLJ89_g7207 [Agrocybe chaxingu]
MPAKDDSTVSGEGQVLYTCSFTYLHSIAISGHGSAYAKAGSPFSVSGPVTFYVPILDNALSQSFKLFTSSLDIVMTSTRPSKRQRTQESQSDSEGPSSSLEDSAKPTAEGESEATESDVEEGSEEDAEEDDQEDFRVKTRSTEYWFNDGNIVLEARQKHYRVHRSVLSRSSAVFTNIFSRPLPQAPLDEPIDGCLILRLDDPSEDIETMLDLLYDSTKTSVFKEETSLAILGTTLRLGRKYYLTMFWDQATLFLERIYSPSLVDWNGAKRPIYEKLTDDKEDVVFGILSFAHEYRLKSILPAVYLAMFLEYDLVRRLSSISTPSM